MPQSRPPVGSAGIPRDPDGRPCRAGRWWALSPIVPLWRRRHTFSGVGVPKRSSSPAQQAEGRQHSAAQRGPRCKLTARKGGDACRPDCEAWRPHCLVGGRGRFGGERPRTKVGGLSTRVLLSHRAEQPPTKACYVTASTRAGTLSHACTLAACTTGVPMPPRYVITQDTCSPHELCRDI